jgi:ribonuclease E
MADKMLIDAAHPEETRVVVLRGNRVEEFDFESANRRQLRGNIYLAKVTRVEPSLQAAFVDYGGNRHGFLAFSEIHPDYYQIPVADRQALIAQEERDQRAADDEADNRARGRGGRGRRHRHRGARRREDLQRSEPLADEETIGESAELAADEAQLASPTPDEIAETTGAAGEPQPVAEFGAEDASVESFAGSEASETAEQPEPYGAAPATAEAAESGEQPDLVADAEHGEDHAENGEHPDEAAPDEAATESEGERANGGGNSEDQAEDETVESVGGADALEEVQERLPRFRRQY